jgi:hypothetical protein
LENDLLRTLKFVYANLGFVNNLYGDLNKTLTIFTNPDFNVLNAVNDIIFDKAISDKDRKVLIDLAKNVLQDNKKLSNAIIDCGVKGPQFGAVLNELKNWYYGAYLYNHKKPTQTEIEEKVEELMR